MSVTLIRNPKTTVYNIVEIYNPDIHVTDSLKDGKAIPAVGSIVIDNVTTPGVNIAYVVDVVDPATFKVTLSPLVFSDVEDIASDQIVNYGNGTLMLYYDDRTTPTKIIVDSKFSIVGQTATEVRITKATDSGYVPIAFRLGSDSEEIGDRIPIIDSGAAGIKSIPAAYTTDYIAEGDLMLLEVYDSAGVQTTQARMVTKRANILNDLLSENNPIVNFTSEVNQTDGSHWLLYTNQNTEDLTIFPEVVFSNGTRERITIDNNVCFIYGTDDINTSVAGVEFPVLIKYFITDDMASTIAEGNGVRFISQEHIIKVVTRDPVDYSKIAILPLWNQTENKYTLSFFGYHNTRNEFTQFTDNDVTFVNGTSFDGDLLGSPQSLSIELTTDNGNGDISTFTQNIEITLFGEDHITPYVFAKDNVTPFVYGVQTSENNRPEINYDSVRESYFIPTSKFPDLESLLDNFYIRSEPPFLANIETEPPTPTHITIRNSVSGRVIIPSPIRLDAYEGEFNLTTTGLPSQYLGETVIVEFLIEVDGTHSILYGVPVKVKSGSYNV